MPETIQHDAILEIRLNRPPANALDPATVANLTRLLREAPAGGSQAVVLSGAPRMFSAGLDVPLLQKLTRVELTHFWESFFALLRALAECKLPIAAALTGHAPAGGTALAVFCDHRVMSEGDFKLGLNEVRVGLPLPRPIHVAFERLCGERIASEYAMEGKLVTGAQALAIGLVDELAPNDEVVGRAVAWCRGVLQLPAQAMLQTRSFARRRLVAAFDHATQDAAEMSHVWHAPEAQAAIARLLQQLRK